MRLKSLILLVFLNVIFCNSFAQAIGKTEKTAIKKIVYKWSDAHNKWSLDVLKKLYAPEVLFYCKKTPREKCISKISNMLSPTKAFKHEIVSINDYKQFENGLTGVFFTKAVTENDNTKEYPSYLILSKTEQGYKIIGESDEVTDKNLKFQFDPNLFLGVSTNEEQAQTVIAAPEPVDKSKSIALYALIFFFITASIYVVYKKSKNKKKEATEEKVYPEPFVAPEKAVVEKDKDGWKVKAKQVRSNAQKENPIIETVVIEKPNETDKPELTPEEKGREFEQYIISKFPRNYFEFLDWRGDKFHRGNYAKSNTYPDLEYNFTYNDYSRRFAIECKYRSKSYGKLEIDETQFKNYKQYGIDQNIDVYIIFGIGGKPNRPEKLLLGKLDELSSNIIYERQLHECDMNAKYILFFNSKTHRLT